MGAAGSRGRGGGWGWGGTSERWQRTAAATAVAAALVAWRQVHGANRRSALWFAPPPLRHGVQPAVLTGCGWSVALSSAEARSSRSHALASQQRSLATQFEQRVSVCYKRHCECDCRRRRRPSTARLGCCMVKRPQGVARCCVKQGVDLQGVVCQPTYACPAALPWIQPRPTAPCGLPPPAPACALRPPLPG